MDVKVCDLCGRRINNMTYFGCKVKKPRKYKWINSCGLYSWSSIEICNKCAEIIADIAQEKDQSK
jgi:hypothetical protein